MKNNGIKKTFIASVLSVLAMNAFSQPATCTDSSRDCMISAANSYLQAVVSHDTSAVTVTSDAHRWENGVITADSGSKILDSLQNDPKIKAVKAIRDLRFFVDGDHVLAMFLLDVNIPGTDIYYGTTHLAESFQIDHGAIKEVEAIFCASGRMTKEESKMNDTSIPFVCTRSAI